MYIIALARKLEIIKIVIQGLVKLCSDGPEIAREIFKSIMCFSITCLLQITIPGIIFIKRLICIKHILGIKAKLYIF